MKPGSSPPDRRLARLILTLPLKEIQNRLLNSRDRELALAMTYLKDEERLRIYSAVSPVKSRRLREELSLNLRLAIRYQDYLSAVERVIGVLEGRSYTAVPHSYIRPSLRRRRYD